MALLGGDWVDPEAEEPSFEGSYLSFKAKTEGVADVKSFRPMVDMLIPREVPLPEGTKCFSCGSLNVTLMRPPMSGPFSGRITCKDCAKQETAMSCLARNMIVTESLDATPTQQ